MTTSTTMVFKSLLWELILLLVVVVVCVQSKKDGGAKSIKLPPIPRWKSLLIHHHRWSGYYSHDLTRFMCSMFVHSVDSSDKGTAHVTFVAEGFHIEMMVSSEDNKAVTFQEIHTWNKTGHFEGHTDITFQGAFVEDYGYFKFMANVSSSEAQNYGSVTLIPRGRSLNDNGPSNKPRSKTFSLAMAVGIPMFLGLICLTLAIFIVIWAVRKGYLRRMPWLYKSFHNPTTTTTSRASMTKSDVEMEVGKRESKQDESPPQTETGSTNAMTGQQQAVTVQGVEKTAVHI